MNWKRFALFAATAFLALGFGAKTAYAGGKSIRICNMRGSTLSVAIGYFDNGFPVASGWYILSINQCGTVSFPRADSIMPMFAYAFDVDGKEFRPNAGGTNNFCITRGVTFIDKSTAFCQARDKTMGDITSDWESFGMLGFPLSDFYRWELR